MRLYAWWGIFLLEVYLRNQGSITKYVKISDKITFSQKVKSIAEFST